MNTENDNITPPAAPETPAAVASENTPPAVPEQPAVESPAAEPGLLARIGTIISRALAADPKRAGWELTCYMLLESLGGQILIVGPKWLEKLRAWQVRYDRCIDAINSHTQAAAKQAWLAHSQTLADAITSGTIGQHQGRTLESWEADYDAKVRAAHVEMSKIYQECQPCAEEISARFVSIATRKVTAMEEAERQRHEEYGIKYLAPSNLVVAFKAAIKVAAVRTVQMPSGNASPKSMLPYINL